MKSNQKNKRFRQANKEAWISILVTIVYFIWWYVFAYGLGNKPVEEYSYVLGLPAWFFYSCVLGFIMFSTIVWIVVNKYFVDMPLTDDEKDAQ